MKKPKSKEELLKERVSGIQSRGGDCEIKGDYALCTAPWFPFRWLVEVVELETGGYGLRPIICEFSDDPRCGE